MDTPNKEGERYETFNRATTTHGDPVETVAT